MQRVRRRGHTPSVEVRMRRAVALPRRVVAQPVGVGVAAPDLRVSRLRGVRGPALPEGVRFAQARLKGGERLRLRAHAGAEELGACLSELHPARARHRARTRELAPQRGGHRAHVARGEACLPDEHRVQGKVRLLGREVVDVQRRAALPTLPAPDLLAVEDRVPWHAHGGVVGAAQNDPVVVICNQSVRARLPAVSVKRGARAIPAGLDVVSVQPVHRAAALVARQYARLLGADSRGPPRDGADREGGRDGVLGPHNRHVRSAVERRHLLLRAVACLAQDAGVAAHRGVALVAREVREPSPLRVELSTCERDAACPMSTG